MKKFLFTVAILAGSLTFASTANNEVQDVKVTSSIQAKAKKLIKVITSCGEIGYFKPCEGDSVADVVDAALEIESDLCGK